MPYSSAVRCLGMAVWHRYLPVWRDAEAGGKALGPGRLAGRHVLAAALLRHVPPGREQLHAHLPVRHVLHGAAVVARGAQQRGRQPLGHLVGQVRRVAERGPAESAQWPNSIPVTKRT